MLTLKKILTIWELITIALYTMGAVALLLFLVCYGVAWVISFFTETPLAVDMPIYVYIPLVYVSAASFPILNTWIDKNQASWKRYF